MAEEYTQVSYKPDIVWMKSTPSFTDGVPVAVFTVQILKASLVVMLLKSHVRSRNRILW